MRRALKQCRVSEPKDEKKALKAVERALYMKAVGFVQREERTIVEEDGKGGCKTKKEISEKQVPPDGGCIMTWLKDRQPERWARAEGNEGGPASVTVVSEAPRPEGE